MWHICCKHILMYFLQRNNIGWHLGLFLPSCLGVLQSNEYLVVHLMHLACSISLNTLSLSFYGAAMTLMSSFTQTGSLKLVKGFRDRFSICGEYGAIYTSFLICDRWHSLLIKPYLPTMLELVYDCKHLSQGKRDFQFFIKYVSAMLNYITIAFVS